MPVVFETRSSVIQRKFVELYIQYGRDFVKAYVDSRTVPVKLEGRKLRAKAQAYLKSNTIRRLMEEMDAKALANIEVKNQYGMANAIEKYGITKERIMIELASIAFAKPSDVMEWGPDGVKIKDSSELTPEQLAAVGEVSESSGGGKDNPIVHVKIKMLDKQQALINLGKELGMFSQKVEHKGEVAVAAKFIVEGR